VTSAVRAAREKSLHDLDRELAIIGKTLPASKVAIVVKRTALDALRRIVRRTPVDTGRARGNWQVSLGEPAIGEVPFAYGPIDSKASGTIEKGKIVINTVGLGGGTGQLPPIVWITNNVPYILVLEEGGFVPSDPGPSKDPRKGREGRVLVSGGYSVQAPNGMVAVTLQELLTQFDSTNKDTKQ